MWKNERLDVRHDQPRPAAPEEMACSCCRPGSARRHRSRRRVDDRRRATWSCRFAPTPGEIDDDVDPEPPSWLAATDSREQQELRRLDRPGADDDLVLGAHTLDASRRERPRRRRSAAPRRGDAWRGRRSRRSGSQHRGPAGGRRSPCSGGRRLDVQLGEGDAVERRSVVVLVERDACLLRSRDEPRHRAGAARSATARGEARRRRGTRMRPGRSPPSA